MSQRSSLLPVLALLATLPACATAESPEPPPPVERIVLVEEYLGEATTVRFVGYGDEVVVEIDGPIDYDDEARELAHAALEAGTPTGIFLALHADDPKAVPLALIDAELRLDLVAPSEGELAVDDSGGDPIKPGGLSSWDWNADATWFRDHFCRVGTPDCYTNWISTFAQRKGYQHRGTGMNASFTGSARYISWWEDCGFWGCEWKKHPGHDIWVTPRWYHTWDWMLNREERMRKFEIFGSGQAPRVHLGLIYGTYYQPTYQDNMPDWGNTCEVVCVPDRVTLCQTWYPNGPSDAHYCRCLTENCLGTNRPADCECSYYGF